MLEQTLPKGRKGRERLPRKIKKQRSAEEISPYSISLDAVPARQESIVTTPAPRPPPPTIVIYVIGVHSHTETADSKVGRLFFG